MKSRFIFLCCFIVGIKAYDMRMLTVLTGPVGTQSLHQYLGHFGVTRSLIEGLKKSGISFNYNPQNVDQLGDVVHIVAGDGAVIQQIIDLKKSGHVKKIIVGPNAYNKSFVANKNIDLRIDPSEWVRDAHVLFYEELNQTDYLVWPAGVDEHYFDPKKMNDYTSKRVLVYNKEQHDLTHRVVTLLKEYHFEPIVITYGSYHKEQFKRILETVSFAIFLSKTESQGLALAECWAMDVPTLCWNLKCPHKYLEIEYPVSSACPYLTQETGFSWKTITELEDMLRHGVAYVKNCSPRNWVLKNMTDEIVVYKLIKAIKNLS